MCGECLFIQIPAHAAGAGRPASCGTVPKVLGATLGKGQGRKDAGQLVARRQCGDGVGGWAACSGGFLRSRGSLSRGMSAGSKVGNGAEKGFPGRGRNSIHKA